METAIKNLKDKSMSRLTVYKHLNLALDCKQTKLDKDNVDALFDIFNSDLLQGTQNGVNSLILNSIKLILDSIKDDDAYSTSLENITLTLFKHLIAIVRFPQVQGNQKICWEMISSLSDTILKNVMNSNEKQISSFISQSLNANIDSPVKIMISNVLLRWLKTLTVDELANVTIGCMNAWFGYTIPTMFLSEESQRNVSLETIELVLPHLKKVDYTNNPKWMAIMIDLQGKKKYTPALLQMFQKKDSAWRSVWCFMLRLLEKDLKKNGLLINALLPVLEQAFRDESTRRDAFYCWRVLTDVCISKKIEQNNAKIVRLLCTPLNSNNAKSIETALMKFDVWWFLITSLSHEISTYLDNLLYPFLNFCFGCNSGNEQIIPGLVFPPLQQYTVSAFVEMLGHEESCKGCCVGDKVLHLDKPIMNSVLFDSASKRWMDAVKSAIVILSEQMLNAEGNGKSCDGLKQNLKCIWTSFLRTATKIVNPNLMTMTFRNILKILDSLCENYQNNRIISEMMIEILIPQMVSRSHGYSAEFLNDTTNYKNDSNITPIRALFLFLLSPKLQKCPWPESKVLPFRELICVELDNSVMDFCGWIIVQLKNSEPSISIWCHLSDALTNSKYSNINDIYEIVLCWPLDNEFDSREIQKISHSWLELYTFVALKISTPKKKSLSFFEECLVSRISKVSETSEESKLMMCVYFLSSIIKHRAKSNPVSQVTNQPPSLNVLQELLVQLKKSNITDYIVATVIEAVDCVACVLASYNSRRATPEYLQMLIKTSEATLKTVNYCLQKAIFTKQSSEYSKRLSGILQPYMFPTFATACCQTVSDIILTLCKKNEEDVVSFKGLLHQVYKSEAVNAGTGKKLDKLLKDKDVSDFKSPQQKPDGNGKVKASKNEVANAKNEEFVVIKPNWKFDPKKLTEHQKEVLGRRRENIPALYEDLSQSQDDYNMKAWKPTGYTNDETSESSQDHGSRDKSSSREATVLKENVKATENNDEKTIVDVKNDKDINNMSGKKVLRNIPNPGLPDSSNNLSPQNIEIKTNKSIKLSDENIDKDNIKLTIVASPKVANKMTSFQSRLERSIKKLQEGSVKLDNTSPTAKTVQEPITNFIVTSPIVKKVQEPSSNIIMTPPAKKVLEVSENNAVTPSSVKQNNTITDGTSPVITKVIHAYVKSVVTSSVANPKEQCTLKLEATPPTQNILRPPESDRPTRHRKKPNKFDPDDVRFIGKRRASTSMVDFVRSSSFSDRDDSSETSSVNSDSVPNTVKDDDTTPTKIKRRKMRLLKNLEIDTVDGHPNKEFFDFDKPSRRRSMIDDNTQRGPESKRRRISIDNKYVSDNLTRQKVKDNAVKAESKSRTKKTSESSQEITDSSQESNQADREMLPITEEASLPSDINLVIEKTKNNTRKIGPKSKTRNTPPSSQEITDSSQECLPTEKEKTQVIEISSTPSEKIVISSQEINLQKVKDNTVKACPKSRAKKTSESSQEITDSSQESIQADREMLPITEEASLPSDNNLVIEKTKINTKKIGPKSKTRNTPPIIQEITDSSQGCLPTEEEKTQVMEINSTPSKKIVISSQEIPHASIIDAIPVSQSEPIILSDEPANPVEESVIIVESSLGNPIQVTDQLSVSSSERNEKELPSVSESSKQTVIELSDEEDDDSSDNYSQMSQDVPESQDVIQSSQDSTSNMSVTPRRIATIINGKNKVSPAAKALRNVADSRSNSVIVIPDTQYDNINTAEIDTLAMVSATTDNEVAEKSTQAIEPSISTTAEIVGADTEMIEAETQMHDDETVLDASNAQPIEVMNVDEPAEFGHEEDIQDKEIEIQSIPISINDYEHNKDDEPITEIDVSEIVDLDGDVDGKDDETDVIEADNDLDETNEDIEKEDSANRSTILSSPYKDDIEDRNAELLNSTLDMSPIKAVEQEIENEDKMRDNNDLESLGCKVLSDNDSSSDSDQASSPTTSRNASPVIPAEISPASSPPKSSLDKLSPDNDKIVPPENSSPSRVYSPSSSANQMKNRTLMSRFGGRAAQMLGMCKRGPVDNSDNKFSNVTSLSPVRMIARKNLYNSYGNGTSNETLDSTPKNEDENLLEFSKTLPSPYASPSGPILKKDQSLSPTGKKKRVSFHDPPVSKQLNIEKYIEPPQVVRSPQRAKVVRSYKDEPASFMKQPKAVYCLVKKIDSVEATVSDLNDNDQTESNLSEICSLEAESQQPIDLVNNALLDDTQPIYPTLIGCGIPISELASDLTSESCKNMFLDEVKDDIVTIGDLAKLTELKVNRLPISFPKISTVKKALSDFESTMKRIEIEIESEEMDVEIEGEKKSVEEQEESFKDTLDSEKIANITTQVMDVSEGTLSEIKNFEEHNSNCTNDIHLIGNEHIDFNSDEDMIKLLDKILQRKTVATYLSQNIHKYFNILVPK